VAPINSPLSTRRVALDAGAQVRKIAQIVVSDFLRLNKVELLKMQSMRAYFEE